MDNNTPQTQNGDNQTEKQKSIRKILIGVIIFVVFFGAIFIAYRYFTSEEKAPEDSLFPIASDIIKTITGDKEGDEETEKVDAVLSESSRIVELYTGPVAGYTLLPGSTSARVFDRTKGLIFDINLINGEIKAVTDQPILKVHDVLFIGENTIITRSLDSNNIIKSNLYEFSQGDTNEILRLLSKPSFLSDNILEMAKSQNNKYVVFVIKEPKGGNVDIYDTETKKLTRLISTPLTEWIPRVTNDGMVFVSLKASKYADSGTYKIVNGSLHIVEPAKTAQTSILSPDGNNLFSTAIYNNEFLSSIIFTDKTNKDPYETQKIKPSIFTLADKCTWDELGTRLFCGVPKKFGINTPDEWYLGNISYVDNIWEYNLKTGETKLVLESLANQISVDIIEMTKVDNTLYFKNKKDEHLWGYRLATEANNPETNIVEDEIVNEEKEDGENQ